MKKVLIKDQIKMISAAHFLEETEDNSVYVYYTDFNKSEPSSAISVVYQAFSDVFNEKAEDILPSHQGELNHHIELLLSITPSFRSLYNLSEQELRVLKNYINKHL